jgi:deazaflavin-dependent oxidoreductase (nitroreductase family)
MYMADGDDLVVVASKSGGPENPSWWSNLEAAPVTTVQVGGARRVVRARQASAEEKSRLWTRLVDGYPLYETYQSRTDRELPVVVLEAD